MTSYDTSANVKSEVEDNGFTISATGSITDATFLRFLTKADERVTADDPGFSQAQANEACGLLVCHQIARRQGLSGKTAESGIGRYGYSRKLESGLTSWMDEYLDLLNTVSGGGSVTAEDLLGDNGTGIDHLDVQQSKTYRLDQEPDQGQVTKDTEDSNASTYFYGGA